MIESFVRVLQSASQNQADLLSVCLKLLGSENNKPQRREESFDAHAIWHDCSLRVNLKKVRKVVEGVGIRRGTVLRENYPVKAAKSV